MGKYRRKKLKKQRKIIIASAICLTFLITAGYAAFSTNLTLTAKGNLKNMKHFYVSANGSDTEGNGNKENPYLTIQKAYDMAPATTPATIHVMTDLTATSTTTMSQSKNIILTSYSESGAINSITRGDSFLSYIINQTAGELTLENIILDGNNVTANVCLLRIGQSGTLASYTSAITNINKGTIIKNGKTSQVEGAAIVNRGTLNINDGEISNNEARGSGAIWSAGIINMNGGIISNNKATGVGSDSEDAGWGGAIGLTLENTLSGKLNITGGTITNNSAIFGGAIQIHNEANELTINNGTISNNTASTYAGGINCDLGTIIMSGGTIEGNNAGTYGGAVSINTGCSFTLEGGSIKNNTAQTEGTGSIYVSPTSAVYTYNSGIVCGGNPYSDVYDISGETCPE